MGMTFGIGYAGFEVLKVWLSNGNNNLYVESTHTGVTLHRHGRRAVGRERHERRGQHQQHLRCDPPSTPARATTSSGSISTTRASRPSTAASTASSRCTASRAATSTRSAWAGEISSRINVFDESNGDPGHQPPAHLRHQPGRLLPAARQQGHRHRHGGGDRGGREPRAGGGRRDRAHQLRRRHQRRGRDLRPRRRRHLRAGRQPRADDDFRRRGQRHLPGRPGLPVVPRRPATRTTASPRRTTSRPRRSRAASCRTA